MRAIMMPANTSWQLPSPPGRIIDVAAIRHRYSKCCAMTLELKLLLLALALAPTVTTPLGSTPCICIHLRATEYSCSRGVVESGEMVRNLEKAGLFGSENSSTATASEGILRTRVAIIICKQIKDAQTCRLPLSIDHLDRSRDECSLAGSPQHIREQISNAIPQANT